MKNEGACLGRARLKNGDFRDLRIIDFRPGGARGHIFAHYSSN